MSCINTAPAERIDDDKYTRAVSRNKSSAQVVSGNDISPCRFSISDVGHHSRGSDELVSACSTDQGEMIQTHQPKAVKCAAVHTSRDAAIVRSFLQMHPID